MKYLKKYKFILIFVGYVILLSLFMSLMGLFLPFGNKINSLLIVIFMILYCLLFGIKIGLKTEAKAYKVGLKYGLILILVLYLLGGIPYSFAINLKKIIYYLIIVLSIILGSVIGINKKKN